ncbi:DsbE family thiol:disulfide interchange protein [Caulobacter sp. KR2-114]|uniref:DsbE family thiol:disulfide interchange protein n=1 Tax=Caulobacter sp. KR2-114 TaxID=3400912 RepID=UPI003BFE6C3B
MRRLIALLPLAAMAVLVLVFAFRSLHRDPQVTPMATVGQPMPAASLAPLAGGPATPIRTAIKGPVLVNFFASWCAPCISEAPALMALKAEGAPIVGIAYKDRTEDTQGFLAQHGNPYSQVLADSDGQAGIGFGVTGVPETYAIDAQGVIRGKVAGQLSADQAEALLQKIGR